MLLFADESFSNLYVFGDSISDAGNLATLPDFAFFERPESALRIAALAMVLEPCKSSRTSWVLSQSHPCILWARFREPTLRLREHELVGDDPIDLTTQVGAFLLNTSGIAPEDALYVIFAGGNDVRDARDEPDWHIQSDIIHDAVTAIETAIRTLEIAGAQSILVINVADLGAAPETQALAEANDDPSVFQRARFLSRWFNRVLSRRLHRIEKRFELDIVEFDLFGFFNSILAEADALGFSNTDENCFKQRHLHVQSGPVNWARILMSSPSSMNSIRPQGSMNARAEPCSL